MSVEQSRRELCRDFLRDYYRGELARVAQSDESTLTIDHADLRKFDLDLATDLLGNPDIITGAMERAAAVVDLPTPETLDDVDVVVTNLPESHVVAPGKVRTEHGGQYIGVEGTLERVTSTTSVATRAGFICRGCGSLQYTEQDLTDEDLLYPTYCEPCERKGNWVVEPEECEYSDYAKLRIQSDPDSDTDAEGKLTGFAVDSVLDQGGPNGLIERAGEPVTVYGVLRRQQKSGRGANNLLFDPLLESRYIDFKKDEETVDVEAHRETFEMLAGRDDAVDLFAQSIAPELHATDAWEAAFEFAVAYLFGAPRIDIPNGPTYRGDLHFLIVSDYAMGKSTFKEDVVAFSPKVISKSTTALSSDVGLRAAAVKDDFGEGAWTIKPGLLVRANGGHLILDEIDKGPDELENMNDALEGEQTVDIEKAGKSATYQSRTALLAMGNPVDGRFDPHAPIAEQLGIPESLLSRFDGIVTMTDQAEVEQDAAVADTWGRAYTEALDLEYGDRDDLDVLDRPVPIDVGRAWVQHARENVNPVLKYEQFETLKTWYSEEVRQLNSTFAGEGEGQDMPVPATVRELAAAAKMSIAFARLHLRDEVAPQDVDRAKKLAKALVKQNWDGERFDATMNLSQHDRVGSVMGAVRAICDDSDDGLAAMEQVIAAVDDPEPKVEETVRKLLREGQLYEPEHGYVEPT